MLDPALMASFFQDPNVQALLSRLRVIHGILFLELGEVAGIGPMLVLVAAIKRPDVAVGEQLAFPWLQIME